MQKAKIKETDVVYSYKEQAFTGFAPCFQGGVYSLACCKGAKNGKGMRQSICNAVEAGKNVWVLSIAAGGIKNSKYNSSGIDYDHGDAIYLAKIDHVCTWYEYSTSARYKNRRDSYYVLKDGKVDWRKKIKDLHYTPDYLERDCGIGACRSDGRSQEDIFKNEKQILIASEYYIFDKGQRISGVDAYKSLDVMRGFKCNDDGDDRRAVVLQEFLKNNNKFICHSGEDPFETVGESKRGCCK